MLRNRVKEYRERVGLSQERLAAKIGIGRLTIWTLENKPGYTPASSVMVKLSRFFDVELGELFYVEREAVAS